ncbi:hypothetical protein EI94DRAFT_1707294 [Lactarius quietus]|nr:hypothetical protein EI94DRAFT_1707294 [Lactarius quietus]
MTARATTSSVAQLHAFLFHIWYKDSSSGRFKLPLRENVPLGKSLGPSERCAHRGHDLRCFRRVHLENPQSQPGIHSIEVAVLAERGVEFDSQKWTTDKVINLQISESAITGEHIPVIKQVGDAIVSGTVNGLGASDMVVTRAGKAFADHVAVPTITSFAGVTFFGWILLSNDRRTVSLHVPSPWNGRGVSPATASVVIVVCPCALGISAPVAIIPGGAKNGILIKGGRALEASRKDAHGDGGKAYCYERYVGADERARRGAELQCDEDG